MRCRWVLYLSGFNFIALTSRHSSGWREAVRLDKRSNAVATDFKSLQLSTLQSSGKLLDRLHCKPVMPQ